MLLLSCFIAQQQPCAAIATIAEGSHVRARTGKQLAVTNFSLPEVMMHIML